MRTITAKELRDNLDQVVQRVRGGEAIRVTYRSRAAFTLQPEQPSSAPAPGSVEAMRRFVQKLRQQDSVPRESQLDSTKPIALLYHELLDQDPKYETPRG
jgi:antitoxin (DNA-binding transcriptional repressor) of toxin-antitoxin stability system